ncbi:MAG: PAS domain-containing sensor histidine kinase, partial [SAR324 cluster bacterium]|nr:PAS domain-containing sensor histidine kinase [SAR324 cluster bacterium]
VPQADASYWEHVSQRASQKGWQGEVLLQHPTKEAIPADCSISAVHDADGEAMAYSVILRDISERKALEEETRRQRQELERAYQKLRELDRAKSKFLSLVSHELRTPIASIMAYSEVLNTEGMADPEDQTKFIDVIHQEAEKLTEMVNKVLAMSKMESGQMLFNFAENQLEELVRMQVAMWRPRAESKHLVMTYEAEPELRPTVYDEDNIREAVEQLIDNAIKYTESGTIKVRVSQDDSETWIRIEDSGRGIEGQDLGQLLENFGRGDQTATGHGLGLGLPLCYLIVKAHSGELHLEPNQQKGTTASIVLPLRPPPEAMAS